MVSSYRLPKHIAFIVDGNRRWAKEKGLSTFEGHKKGFDALNKIISYSQHLGIQIFTLWGFSTENWNRSPDEVKYLMNLFSLQIDKYLKKAIDEEIRIIHLGRKDRFNKDLRNKLINAENKTKNFNKYYLCIALDYGGQDEVIRAINKISNLEISNLTINNFNDFLDTKDLPYPNPDLVIRTSGEMRISGFMIWQAAYSEYIFVKKNFPDFTEADFDNCLKEYSKRQRRFGK